jgi:hypothetical protein
VLGCPAACMQLHALHRTIVMFLAWLAQKPAFWSHAITNTIVSAAAVQGRMHLSGTISSLVRLSSLPPCLLLCTFCSCACRHAAASSQCGQLPQRPRPAPAASTRPHQPPRCCCSCCLFSFSEQRRRQLRFAANPWPRHGRQGRGQAGDWAEQQ